MARKAAADAARAAKIAQEEEVARKAAADAARVAKIAQEEEVARKAAADAARAMEIPPQDTIATGTHNSPPESEFSRANMLLLHRIPTGLWHAGLQRLLLVGYGPNHLA